MSTENLKEVLTQFQDQIGDSIKSVETKMEEALAAQSDAGNTRYEELSAALEELKSAQATYDEQLQKVATAGNDPDATRNFRDEWNAMGGMDSFIKGVWQDAQKNHPNGKYRGKVWAHAEGMPELLKYAAKREGVIVDDNGSVVGYENKAFNADDGSEGGFFIPEEISSEYIDLVTANMPIMQMPGIMRLDGLRGDLPIPKVLTGITGYHVGETEAPTESTGSVGLKYLRAKKVGAFTKMSNKLAYQSAGVMENIVRSLLSRGVALEMHRGLLNGKGSESEPLGLLKYSSMTTTLGGSSVGLSSAGRFTTDDASTMEAALDAADELRDTPTYGYLMHPTVKHGMKTEKVMQYSGQTRKNSAPALPGSLLLSNSQLEEQLGYALKTTTQFPTGTSGDHTTTDVLFGDWSMFWVGFWRSPIVKVSDVASDTSNGSAFLQDQMYLVMFQDYDCRLMREAAFCKVSDASITKSAWTS